MVNAVAVGKYRNIMSAVIQHILGPFNDNSEAVPLLTQATVVVARVHFVAVFSRLLSNSCTCCMQAYQCIVSGHRSLNLNFSFERIACKQIGKHYSCVLNFIIGRQNWPVHCSAVPWPDVTDSFSPYQNENSLLFDYRVMDNAYF
jgi:hypothetical protein